MTYDELASKIEDASNELYLLGKEAEKFENCRIMYIAAETLKGMSYSLESIAEGLVGE